MKPTYSLQDICNSHLYLGHQPHYTELNAYHKDFKQGKEHYEWNYQKRAFTKIAYVKNEQGVKNFVQKYHNDHLCCYSLNPRQKVFQNAKGYPRAALESEIAISQNFFIDLDFIEKKHLDEKIASLELLFPQFDEYFLHSGAQLPPVKAYTGQGYHLLFAMPKIKIKNHPDIRNRIKSYQDQFRHEFSKTFGDVGIKVDSIHDLKRMVKIYGATKPQVGRLSKFYGGERHEDAALRKHLLEMKLKEPTLESKVVESINDLPQLFNALLERDHRLQVLWRGQGKSESSDTSRSGFDFSLVKYLLRTGMVTDINDLSAILSKRPNGAVQGSGKGESYLRNTIANAIKNS